MSHRRTRVGCGGRGFRVTATFEAYRESHDSVQTTMLHLAERSMISATHGDGAPVEQSGDSSGNSVLGSGSPNNLTFSKFYQWAKKNSVIFEACGHAGAVDAGRGAKALANRGSRGTAAAMSCGTARIFHHEAVESLRRLLDPAPREPVGPRRSAEDRPPIVRGTFYKADPRKRNVEPRFYILMVRGREGWEEGAAPQTCRGASVSSGRPARVTHADPRARSLPPRWCAWGVQEHFLYRYNKEEDAFGATPTPKEAIFLRGCHVHGETVRS